MFTPAEIERAAAVFVEVAATKERLKTFCRPACLALDFHEVTDVAMEDGSVFFHVSYYGSFQSDNHEVFEFANDWLTKDPHLIAEFLRNKRAEKQRLAKEGNDHTAALRASVLSKLTKEERRAIGV